MKNSLCTVAGRGVTVLVGSAVFALVASGAADATTTVTHDADKGQATAYTMRAFDGERDGNSVYANVHQSIEPSGDDDMCDWIKQCIPPGD